MPRDFLLRSIYTRSVRICLSCLVIAAAACTGLPRATSRAPAAASCPLPAAAAFEAVGDEAATASRPTRRIVLMGGSREVTAAARLFAEAAGGGDLLVLRASGNTSSYNAWFAGEIGATPAPAHVSTIRIAEGRIDAGVLCRAGAAAAVWLAGGDQWNYLGRWPHALHDSLAASAAKGRAIGGTSAGAMSLGEFAFDARVDGVSSTEALPDPFHPAVTVSPSAFAQPELTGTLIDSHFMQREREGRLLVFLTRLAQQQRRDTVFGVGLDERAALVIEDGRFLVLTDGDDRYVWIYRLVGRPELQPGVPLTLTGVQRLRLSSGSAGEWPIDLSRYATEVIRVVNGRIEIGGK